MTPKHTSHLNWELDNEAFLKLPGLTRQESESQYQIVPESAKKADNGQPPAGSSDAGKTADKETPRFWRIVLTPVGITGKSMPLEIRGDVVIGAHRESDEKLDINVDVWHGYEHGVSRRHVMLRPSRHKIFVMDLKSTNGTHINGLPLGVGWAYALKDGDLITMGRLHIRVRITQEPTADSEN